ncbi:hypothetical protein BLNAU_17544 [Blattamonas nauphoetae]|uniref:SPRY domain-containing protein n=1 Tax=Blattamonas nauphoetae TaxID=2049346 RepID=A0ABQ9X710_9EUKA|nr:hypothetical protein BLNAU_17544 [Blattamonas nauphoetae]
MLPEPQPNIAEINNEDELLLQRMMTILDECFDSHTPIANKRLLHSSLSQLTQSPSLTPSIRRDVDKCLAALNSVDEGQSVVLKKEPLESMGKISNTFSNSQQKHDTLLPKLSERDITVVNIDNENGKLSQNKPDDQLLSSHLQLTAKCSKLEQDLTLLRAENDSFVSRIDSLQKEKEEMRVELTNQTQKLEENECVIAFSPDHFRVNGFSVTRTNFDRSWASCFTKPVSKGIHRLSIINSASRLMIGVCDAAEYPKFLASAVQNSPKAAMMHNVDGHLWSAGKRVAQNTPPEKRQEWSAEADLEKRTLHFFINGVQLLHHFINIPVPLVFALDAYFNDSQIEITFWGELKESSVTFEGTGHRLG